MGGAADGPDHCNNKKRRRERKSDEQIFAVSNTSNRSYKSGVSTHGIAAIFSRYQNKVMNCAKVQYQCITALGFGGPGIHKAEIHTNTSINLKATRSTYKNHFRNIIIISNLLSQIRFT